MHPSEALLARNTEFADSFDQADLPQMPTAGTLILTCMDARVDPASFVSVQLGEALVLRGVGGRATEAVLDELTMVAAMTAGAPSPPAVLVIHHTDCGTARFAQPEMRQELQHAGADPDAAAALAVTDPFATVALDVDRVRTAVPESWRVSGHVYDVKTGRLHAV